MKLEPDILLVMDKAKDLNDPKFPTSIPPLIDELIGFCESENEYPCPLEMVLFTVPIGELFVSTAHLV